MIDARGSEGSERNDRFHRRDEHTWHVRCFVRGVKGRPIALGFALAAALGLVFAGGWARSASEEADALGALFGHARTPSVNVASRASVNPSEAPPRVEPPSDAREFVRRRLERIRAVIRDDGPPAQIAAEIDLMLGDGALVRAALGEPCPAAVPACTNHWDALMPTQRRELSDLLRRRVAKGVEQRLRRTLADEIVFASAKDLGGGRTRIRTQTHRHTSGDPTQIDYVVSSVGSEHRVVDVIVEGASATKSYYEQLHRMLTDPDQGYPFVVRRMEARLARP